MVVTSLTRNQVVRKGTWVRIPPSPLYEKGLSEDRSFFVDVHKIRCYNLTESNQSPLQVTRWWIGGLFVLDGKEIEFKEFLEKCILNIVHIVEHN